MYKEYSKAYLDYNGKYGEDTAIFYLVGKFYEMYDAVDPVSGNCATSMKRVVDILGIQMSVRAGAGPGGTDGLFAGIPEQSLHKYAGILTKQGWTVVIFDQVKDARGAVTDRVVSRILSPGTHVESTTQDALYMASIWLQEASWGCRDAPTFALAAMDLTTGKTFTYESAATGKNTAWSADDAIHFFQVYSPRECVVWWRGDTVTVPSVSEMRRHFGLFGAQIYIEQACTKHQGGLEIPLTREDFLRNAFQVRSLLPLRDALQLTFSPRTERVLCCMLQRLEEMFPSNIRKFHAPERWNPSSTLFLGNQALIQLNMVTPRSEDSILGLFQKTQTTFGRRAIRNRILHPLANSEGIEQYYREVAIFDNLEERDRVVALLRQIGDLPRLHRRITSGEITATDVLLLDQSYRCADQIMEIMGGTCLKGIPTNHAALFHETFSVERALKASENAFCFQNGKAPHVDTTETDIATAFDNLNECLEMITKWAGVHADALRLEYRDVLGPTITGNKASMTAVAQKLKMGGTPYPGIQINQKKASSCVEIPILNSTWETILKKRAKLQSEIQRALAPLCDELVAVNLEAWDTLEEWLGKVDVSYTIWKVSRDLGFVKPQIVASPSASISIHGLRHPLIERQTTRTEYVKHTVELDDAVNSWLVYGMNASGKSSLMKAVGISVLLAQAGCYVPATCFRFSPFKSLYTRILNTDNIWAGLSSFAVEMTEMREIFERADESSLVLGDELCSGTESISATALVGAGLKWLHDRKVKFIFATHLHGILTIPSVSSLSGLRVWHLKVRYEPSTDKLIYERTLNDGPGSSLYGLEVARAMNIPDEVLRLALSIRQDILGISTHEDAPKSQWNSALQRRVCEICKNPVDTEVHHIRQRKDAVNLRFEDGTHQNDLRNLIVVCSKCHDHIHDETVTVGSVVQTSDGPERCVQKVAVSPRKSKWNTEQICAIEAYLQKYPNSPPKRAVFDLEAQGIKITAASLKTFRTYR